MSSYDTKKVSSMVTILSVLISMWVAHFLNRHIATMVTMQKVLTTNMHVVSMINGGLKLGGCTTVLTLSMNIYGFYKDLIIKKKKSY